MKKSVFFLFLSAFILLGYSCSSDDPILSSEPDGELHEVTFSVKNLTSETSPMSTRSGLADSGIKYLRYVVYKKTNTDYNNIENIVEEKTLEGTELESPIKLRLANGTYTISFYASERPILTENSKADGGTLGYSPMIDLIVYDDITNPNTFHGSLEFVVNNSEIQNEIKLERTVGKITLAISDLDKAPNDVQTIIPVLCETKIIYDREGPNGPLTGDSSIWAQPHQPIYNIMFTGQSVIWGMPTNNLYSSIYIDKSKFSSINENNPLNFYMLQNTNVQYRVVGQYPSEPVKYDLYLQGSKTNKLENQYIIEGNKDVKNPDVVFMIKIKEGIVINPNEQITIKGSLFKANQGFEITVDSEWGNNTEEILEQPL